MEWKEGFGEGGHEERVGRRGEARIGIGIERVHEGF